MAFFLTENKAMTRNVNDLLYVFLNAIPINYTPLFKFVEFTIYKFSYLFRLLAHFYSLVSNFRRFYQKMCLPQRNRSFKLLKDFVLELLKYNGMRSIYNQLLDWEMPKFPVNGAVLMENGYSGRKMGAILEKLRDIWADSNFQMSQEELMQQHLTPVQQKVAEEESLRKKVRTKK